MYTLKKSAVSKQNVFVLKISPTSAERLGDYKIVVVKPLQIALVFSMYDNEY